MEKSNIKRIGIRKAKMKMNHVYLKDTWVKSNTRVLTVDRMTDSNTTIEVGFLGDEMAMWLNTSKGLVTLKYTKEQKMDLLKAIMVNTPKSRVKRLFKEIRDEEMERFMAPILGGVEDKEEVQEGKIELATLREMIKFRENIILKKEI